RRQSRQSSEHYIGEASRSPASRVRPPRHGGEGNRTPDLLNAIQALSQLSYAPASSANVEHVQSRSQGTTKYSPGYIECQRTGTSENLVGRYFAALSVTSL